VKALPEASVVISARCSKFWSIGVPAVEVRQFFFLQGRLFLRTSRFATSKNVFKEIHFGDFNFYEP